MTALRPPAQPERSPIRPVERTVALPQGGIRRLWRMLAVVLVGALTMSASPPFTPLVTMAGFDNDERAIVQSALRRFQAAGLELPRTHIRRVGTGRNCGIKARSWDVWPMRIVNMCLVREDIVVHELAHVWSFSSLSRLDKVAWTTRRQVPSWRSKQHRWENRSSEHAADILTWALYWSELDLVPDRISGPVGFDAYSADIAWLLEAARSRPGTAHRAVGPRIDLLPTLGSSPVHVVRPSTILAGRTG